MGKEFDDEAPHLEDLRQEAKRQGLEPYPTDPEKTIEMIEKIYYAARDKRRPQQGE